MTTTQTHSGTCSWWYGGECRCGVGGPANPHFPALEDDDCRVCRGTGQVGEPMTFSGFGRCPTCGGSGKAAPKCDLCFIHHQPDQCSGRPPLPFG